MTLRYAIQSAINEQITFGMQINHEEVKKLIEEIELLNKEIEDTEHSIRHFID